MPAVELIERVSRIIADAEADPDLPDDTRRTLQSVGARLREPVRIAVVGRVKAGKSTLVNALLGQRVAPTDISECTRVVTWFRYGHPERLLIQMKDGRALEAQLTPEGTLPAELGVPVGEVASLHTYLANDSLRAMTLIDTPGIGSVNRDFSASTEEFLAQTHASTAATAAADAVVFMMNQVLMEDELQTLQKLHAPDADGAGASAANTVGILSRADQLGDGTQDPWQVAVALATKYAGTFGSDMATVVPVMGLIAETAEAATITELDVKNLSTLTALEPKDFGRMLWSPDRFVSAEAPVSEPARARLLELLDLFGVERAADFLRAGTAGAVALRRELSILSGISEVKRTLIAHFRDQDHVLKVRSALETLRQASYGSDGASAAALGKLRSAVEALRLDAAMHPINELEVWHECNTGRIELSEGRVEELRRLFSPGSPQTRLGVDTESTEELKEVAKQGMVRWRSFMVNEATPSQAKVCRVVMRSYQLLWEGVAT
jgi:hypothetical protein